MTLFDWPVWALIVFTYVIMQRLAELVYANANTRRLLAEGGREHGARLGEGLFVISCLEAISRLSDLAGKAALWWQQVICFKVGTCAAIAGARPLML